MTISVKHKFQSAKGDGTDDTLIQPSNWNAEHDITLASGKVLGRVSSGAGAVEEITIGSGSDQVAAGDHTHTVDDITDLADVAKTGSYNDLIDTPDGTDTSDFAQKSKNLSDLADASAARTNLGLGTAATKNVGVASGVVGLDSSNRIIGDGSQITNLPAPTPAYNAVGSYIFNNSIRTVNSYEAGTSYSGTDVGGRSGTWRCHGPASETSNSGETSITSYGGLFLRIA